MRTPSRRYVRIMAETLLTVAQLDRLPAYVIDVVEAMEREIRNLRSKLATADGIKPLSWRESHRMPGAQVETLDGTYVFPFTPEERSRATVALCLPNGAKIQLILRHDEPSEVEVYCEGQVAIHPTASNTFRLSINSHF